MAEGKWILINLWKKRKKEKSEEKWKWGKLGGQEKKNQ